MLGCNVFSMQIQHSTSSHRHQRGLWRANEADTVWIEATRHLKVWADLLCHHFGLVQKHIHVYHQQEALQVLHHATYARLQLVQLQACAGRAQQAATTTHAAPDAAPFDADAWGLRALGLQAEGSAAIEHCCIEILRCDPGAVEALQGMKTVGGLRVCIVQFIFYISHAVLRLSNPNLTIWIEGLLLHLDAPWTTLRASAWQWLADALDMWAGGPSNASSTRAEELLRARHWWEAVHFASPWATQQAGMEGGAGHCVDTDKARVAAYICGRCGLWCQFVCDRVSHTLCANCRAHPRVCGSGCWPVQRSPQACPAQECERCTTCDAGCAVRGKQHASRGQ